MCSAEKLSRSSKDCARWWSDTFMLYFTFVKLKYTLISSFAGAKCFVIIHYTRITFIIWYRDIFQKKNMRKTRLTWVHFLTDFNWHPMRDKNIFELKNSLINLKINLKNKAFLYLKNWHPLRDFNPRPSG